MALGRALLVVLVSMACLGASGVVTNTCHTPTEKVSYQLTRLLQDLTSNEGEVKNGASAANTLQQLSTSSKSPAPGLRGWSYTWVVLVAAGGAALLAMCRHKHVYMVDYVCFRPPDGWRVSYASFMEHSALNGMSESNLSFQRKILQHSGLGQQTALPPSFHRIPTGKGMHYSRAESESVLFSLLDDLFSKSRVRPQDITILVLNCCLFYPSPSLSALLVNRYKMPAHIKTFNLSGMGCAASLVAVDMVSHMLRVQQRDTYALVVSSENMSGREYLGTCRSMLITNCIFRTGGAAVLLSNRASDRKRAKYELLHTVRTVTAAEDRSFSCITHGEDEGGNIGVSLSKDLLRVAGEALLKNISSLAPLVLPLRELARYGISTVVARHVLRMRTKAYAPDFKLAFQHCCIHAGGKAVIQELEKSLRLTPYLTEPSRMTLHRFGNTSSTSVWYELAYLDAMRRVSPGDRVWQVALGSGFKCFSAVWRALQTPLSPSPLNPWLDCLSDYPHPIPDALPDI